MVPVLAPYNVKVEDLGIKQLTVSWQPPKNSATIAKYHATVATENETKTCENTHTSCPINGLLGHTVCSINVQSFCRGYFGDPSVPAVNVTTMIDRKLLFGIHCQHSLRSYIKSTLRAETFSLV